MSPVPWSKRINFASTLLLHSCITILIKETLNCLEIARRLLARKINARRNSRARAKIFAPKTSAILDAYTSVFSCDIDGELAELYFTNTGIALLAVSLASAVAMNLFLSNIVLNMIVVGTFVLTWVASTAVGRPIYGYTLLIMALRRAGRFIWSDTPFVNFFSLIYIATVLKGGSTLRLKDYMTLRSIAVLELVFMKAKLASARPEAQMILMRRLIGSERVVLPMDHKSLRAPQDLPLLTRNDIKAFRTSQRLTVMFVKTSVSHQFGCVAGALGQTKLPVPAVGVAIEDLTLGWKLCRLSEDIMILADCLPESDPKGAWSKLMKHMHGILLRRLGKKRVIYLVRKPPKSITQEPDWHSNVNLVTGVDAAWLNGAFSRGQAEGIYAIAGTL